MAHLLNSDLDLPIFIEIALGSRNFHLLHGGIEVFFGHLHPGRAVPDRDMVGTFFARPAAQLFLATAITAGKWERCCFCSLRHRRRCDVDNVESTNIGENITTKTEEKVNILFAKAFRDPALGE